MSRTVYATSFGYVFPSSVPVPAAEPEKQEPRRESVSAIAQGSIADIQLPLAQTGIPVPWFIGRQRIFSPNIMWYGGLSAIREAQVSVTTETTTDNMGKEVIIEKKTTTYNTVGYRVNVQLAIGLGPDIQLLGVYANNILVWSGAAGPARTTFTINSSYIKGNAIFNGGAFDQAPDPYLATYITSDLPGYVGVSYIILQSLRTDQIGSQLSFEAIRIPNPLDLDADINQSGDDVNVASAMVDVITNNWGGAGTDISKVDVASFTAAAIQLADEGNFCALMVKNITKASNILDILQDQAQAIIYTDPTTGLISIRLIRKAGYNPITAPRLNSNNINVNTGMRAFNKNGWPSTVEDGTATFTDRNNNYGVTPVSLQSVSNFTNTGRAKRSMSLDYPTVMNADLAIALLRRDFGLANAPAFNASFEVSRVHGDRKPGDICVINLPEYKLYNVPVFVTKVSKQPLEINTMLVEVQQLIMNDTVAALSAPPAQYDPDLEPTPVDPIITAPPGPGAPKTFREAPYFMVKKKGTVAGYKSAKNAITSQFLLATPIPVNTVQIGWMLQADDGTGFKVLIPKGYVPPRDKIVYWGAIPGMAEYTTSALLETPIAVADGFTTGVIPSVIINNAKVFHTYPLTGNVVGDINSVRNATNYVLINNEIFAYESFIYLSDGRYELVNLHRALLDTVPVPHVLDDRVYILDNAYDYIADGMPLHWSTAPNVDWRFMSDVVSFRNFSGDINYVATGSVGTWKPTFNRGGSPLRPHDTKIAGVRSLTAQPMNIGTGTTISWRTRNRDTNTISLQTDAAEPGEFIGAVRQVHRVLVIDSTSAEFDCGVTSNAADANSISATIPSGAAVGPGQLYVQSEITIDGVVYKSQFKDKLPIYITATKTRTLEGGIDHRVTSTGQIRETE